MIYTYSDYIVPYVRMTRKGAHVVPRAQRYLASKEALAWSLKGQMVQMDTHPIPPKTPFAVLARVEHTAGYRADLDNILKAILDAGNGILYPDDRWADQLTIIRMGSKRDSLSLTVTEVTT